MTKILTLILFKNSTRNINSSTFPGNQTEKEKGQLSNCRRNILTSHNIINKEEESTQLPVFKTNQNSKIFVHDKTYKEQ
jgi:hypothetical protein